MKRNSVPKAQKCPIYQFAVPPKVMDIEKHSLENCITAATKRDGFVVVRKDGQAIALIEPFDQEQYELGIDKEFWKMMEERRKGPRVTLEEVERQLALWDKEEKTLKKSKSKKDLQTKKAVVK